MGVLVVNFEEEGGDEGGEVDEDGGENGDVGGGERGDGEWDGRSKVAEVVELVGAWKVPRRRWPPV